MEQIVSSEERERLRAQYGSFYELLDRYFAPVAIKDIEQALAIADRELAGMMRYDGVPFIWHSIHTATIVILEIGLGRNSTISTLLHDVVRLGKMTLVEVGEMFGTACVGILNGMNLISDVETKESSEQAANFRDLIVSYSTDPRVILIKLADRLEVMRRLSTFPKQKRMKKSWESLNLYAQIAHQLGLYSIKSEMEDISLSYLEQDAYSEIERKLEDSAEQRQQFIVKFLKPIEEKLTQANIKYNIKSRTKSIYSIWSKMRRVRIPFEEVYDIFALRIVIDCQREDEKQLCWSVYSIVTDFYTPNPDRMRDWISIPKSNGYESLHTTVVDKEGNWVEIQIRSERMDEVAERGIAAHWRYKGVKQGGMSSEQWLSKVREMIEEHEPQATVQQLDGGDTMNEVFIFTPKGDLRKMKEGATLLDFAFDIHTGLGETCTGGRVNQRNVPLREVLKNGDIVEVFTSRNQHPKPDWLTFVTTIRARNKIRAYLREQLAKQASLGREELERKVKNWKLDLTIDDCVNILCKHYKTRSGTEMYGQIASGKININEVKDLLLNHLSGEVPVVEIQKPRKHSGKAKKGYADDILVIDDDLTSIDHRFAKCCNPIFGDDVFGFVSVSAGIAIHRKNCPNANRLRTNYPYRILPVEWRSTKGVEGAFQASIKIVADNTTGIVNRITELISQELKINIRSMNLAPNNRGEIAGLINLEVSGTRVVDAIINSISRVKGVQKAYRIK